MGARLDHPQDVTIPDLRKLRQDLRLSQEDAARAIGVSTTAYTRHERKYADVSSPERQRLYALALFGYSQLLNKG